MEDVPDFIKCPDLRYIASEQDFGPRMYGILKETKIYGAKQLLEKQETLERILSKTNDEKKSKLLKQLINISRYLQTTKDQGNPIAKAFTETKLSNFAKNQEKNTKLSMELFLFGNGPKPEAISKKDISQFVQSLVPEALDRILFDCRSKLESCQFPMDEFIRVVLASRLECTKYIVVEGPTQRVDDGQ